MCVDAHLWAHTRETVHQGQAQGLILFCFIWQACNEVNVDFLELLIVFRQVGDGPLDRCDIVLSMHDLEHALTPTLRPDREMDSVRIVIQEQHPLWRDILGASFTEECPELEPRFSCRLPHRDERLLQTHIVGMNAVIRQIREEVGCDEADILEACMYELLDVYKYIL